MMNGTSAAARSFEWDRPGTLIEFQRHRARCEDRRVAARLFAFAAGAVLLLHWLLVRLMPDGHFGWLSAGLLAYATFTCFVIAVHGSRRTRPRCRCEISERDIRFQGRRFFWKNIAAVDVTPHDALPEVHVATLYRRTDPPVTIDLPIDGSVVFLVEEIRGRAKPVSSEELARLRAEAPRPSHGWTVSTLAGVVGAGVVLGRLACDHWTWLRRYASPLAESYELVFIVCLVAGPATWCALAAYGRRAVIRSDIRGMAAAINWLFMLVMFATIMYTRAVQWRLL
jgi:hypothetical protein